MDFLPKGPSKKGDLFDLALSAVGACVFLYGCWKMSIIMAAAGLVIGVIWLGQWKQQHWSDWALLALAAVGLPGEIWLLYRFGFSLWRAFMIPVFAWVIWSQITKLRSISKAIPESEKPMTSFVLWEKSSRIFDDKILAQIISSAWEGDYNSHEENPSCFVVGSSPVFMVKSPLGMFMVHNQTTPYFSKPEEVAESVVDFRTRKAIQEQTAWRSVDLLSEPFDENDTRENVYSHIGRLVAEISGPDTLGLFHPEDQQFYPWTPELESGLKAGDGLNALSESPVAPVIPVESEDSEMAAAIAEARKRWPEFASAFASRHPEQLFSVKAALSVGERTEHIWITVDRVAGEAIHGTLGNEPVDLGNMKIGDRVSLSVSEVEDWVYVLSDNPIGAFTVNAVNNAARKKCENC